VPFDAIDRFIDNKPDRSGASVLENYCVEPGQIVGQEEKSSLRQVLEPEGLNLIYRESP
jgi:hypothetical protein